MGSNSGIDVGRRLVDAVRWWEEGLLAALGAAGHRGMSRTQVLLLCAMDPESGTRASELAKALGVTRQSVHQDVRKLAGRGLVGQRPDPGSRAAKRVVLTDEGQAVRRTALERAHDLEQELAHRLGADAWAGLRAGLDADWGGPVRPEAPAVSASGPGPRGA